MHELVTCHMYTVCVCLGLTQQLFTKDLLRLRYYVTTWKTPVSDKAPSCHPQDIQRLIIGVPRKVHSSHFILRNRRKQRKKISNCPCKEGLKFSKAVYLYILITAQVYSVAIRY